LETEKQIQIVAIALQANVPLLLESDPGLAKTAIIAAINRRLGWKHKALIGSQQDPTDYSGLPYITDKGVEMMAYRWAREFSAEAMGDDPGSIFFDELNMAQPSTLASQFKAIHEGVIGDLKLGRNVARIAAMNPASIANVPELLPALSNRFAHLAWHMSPEYWVQAAISGFADPEVTRLPANWRNYLPQALSLAASYIQRNSENYHQRPTDESQWSKAWPSPRTWEMAMTLIAAGMSIGVGQSMEMALVETCVGPGAAIAFMNYKKELDLPDPKDALDAAVAGKLNAFKFPKKGDQMYAFLNSVVSCFLNNNTHAYWHAAWDILGAAAKEKMDVAASSGKALAKGRQEGYTTPKGARSLFEALHVAGLANVKSQAA
jgi:hypothetical protein